MKTNLIEDLKQLEEKSLRRKLRRVDGPQDREIMIDGQKVINFCSNNYLGLANDLRLKQAAIESIEREGFGSGASRLVCGNMSSHEVLEKKLAEFKQTQKSLVFSTGYMANVGIIASLFGKDDCIFSDRLNHASIIDGIRLSGAEHKRYPHVDMDALEAMLKESGKFKKRAIITDSVFSMDGDIAPLDRIVRLAQKYDCSVMVDEAHAIGVFGKNGRGLVSHFNLEAKVDIQMGTLSKAVGSFGAYCCGCEELIDFLINKARSFIYTTGMPPSVAAASVKSLEIIENDDARRPKLWENTHFVMSRLKSIGFDTLNSQSPIIPILIKDSEKAVVFSKRLLEQGIFISAIRPPTVPANTARLRITLMAVHTQNDLQHLLSNMESIGKDLCLI